MIALSFSHNGYSEPDRWNNGDDAKLAALFAKGTLDTTPLNNKSIHKALKHFPGCKHCSFQVLCRCKGAKWWLLNKTPLDGACRGGDSECSIPLLDVTALMIPFSPHDSWTQESQLLPKGAKNQPQPQLKRKCSRTRFKLTKKAKRI